MKVARWWKKFRNFALLIGLVSTVAIVWHYWFSIKVTSGLKFPENPKALLLAEEQEVSVMRGAFNEKYSRKIAAGRYEEVLRNEHGSFYLAPPLGFLVAGGRSSGLGVGGIYLSNENPDQVYLWDYLLKNENRNFENSSTSRQLSMTEDQPERAMFLDLDWYEEKGWNLLGRPMIDEGFVLKITLFRDAGLALQGGE